MQLALVFTVAALLFGRNEHTAHLVERIIVQNPAKALEDVHGDGARPGAGLGWHEQSVHRARFAAETTAHFALVQQDDALYAFFL